MTFMPCKTIRNNINTNLSWQFRKDESQDRTYELGEIYHFEEASAIEPWRQCNRLRRTSLLSGAETLIEHYRAATRTAI